MVTTALYDVRVPGVTPAHEGKVRSVFDLGDELLIVATDRVSAYDVVIPTPIPDKGRVLTQISQFWFVRLPSAQPHHSISTRLEDFPEPFKTVPELEGRSMLCRKTTPVKVECIVRGYLTGSGFREYRDHGTLNGEKLPAGLEDGSKFDEPRFTPSTKADEGHDEAMTWQEYKDFLGEPLASQLRDRTLALYAEAAPHSEDSGMILVDSKFEFGIVDGEILLIDECFSPDSSRYWDSAEYAKGKLVSFDKQYLRDGLDKTGWDHNPPAPELDEATVQALHDRYLEAVRRLMGEEGARKSGLLGAAAK